MSEPVRHLLGTLMLSLACHGLLFFLPWLGQFGLQNANSNRPLAVRLVISRGPTLRPPATAVAPPPVPLAPAEAAPLPDPPPAPPGLPAYVPSEALTEQPQPILDIDPHLPLPPGEALVAEARLELLINAQGGVDRVIPEQSSLPEDALTVLMERFLAARFSPGRQGEQAVACRIKIHLRLEAD